MGWLVGLLGGLATFLLKLWQGRGPSQLQQEAEKVGAAEAQLDVKAKADERVQATTDATAGVVQRVSTDDGLRKYEATDSANRDNNQS